MLLSLHYDQRIRDLCYLRNSHNLSGSHPVKERVESERMDAGIRDPVVNNEHRDEE